MAHAGASSQSPPEPDEGQLAGQQIAAEAEGGGRQPLDATTWLISGLALLWSFFQLYNAYWPLNSIIARSIHLTFAISMVYLAFPGKSKPGRLGWLSAVAVQIFPGIFQLQRSTKIVIPWYDYALAVIAGVGAIYMAWDYEGIIERSGLPISRDVVMGTILIVLLLEAARRAIGPALPVTGPPIFAFTALSARGCRRSWRIRGIPLEFVVEHMYLSDSGIWGVPIGVSTDFVFLFVLFGSLLDKAGAAELFRAGRLRRAGPSSGEVRPRRRSWPRG